MSTPMFYPCLSKKQSSAARRRIRLRDEILPWPVEEGKVKLYIENIDLFKYAPRFYPGLTCPESLVFLRV